MEKTYLSISGETVTEKIIEKSRFITTSRPVEDEEQAKLFVAQISKKYYDATHNCYAFICDERGNFMRFSDDGEPQGTAGMPILEVIKAKNLVKTAVIVTRYFGGVKLGAGGLVRAYSGCAAENLDRACKVSYELCAESLYTVDYPDADAAIRFFGTNDCNVENTEYLDRVTFTVAVRKEREEEFDRALVNALNGRIKKQRVKEYFYPFKV